ncbi:MAG: porin family protein [Balneola sp.]|nr:MAG: porin family protein [Balneola sp.]
MTKVFSVLIPLVVLFTSPAFAQLEVGASYELRDEDPQSGFGLRVQKSFLDQLSMVNVGLQAHFSFFSDQNDVSEAGISYSQDLTNYDFGIAVIGGVSVGLIEPYLGLGLGSTTLDINRKDIIGAQVGLEPGDESESNVYWNGIVGAKVSIIPILKPFVEYRYSDTSLSGPELSEATTGRILFGVSLSF